jgi:NAD(P)-dependent dehydrogenase (short-subunit alcohol dehydrogenase family)
MNVLNRILDLSIVGSFDRSGFERHRRRFDPGDLKVDLTGRRFLVTGANSGLGLEASRGLVTRGAEVWMLCRSRERGEAARSRLTHESGSDRVFLAQVDLAEPGSILDFVRGWPDLAVDGLIHNAGVLLDRREETSEGVECTVATHVLGPFVLTVGLMERLRRAQDARVVTVSSGGMYTQRLSLEDFEWKHRPFDGVAAYAQAKRAQVVLNELWAERTRGSGIAFHSMHPGWADTPGVRSSLPAFYRFMKGRLRTPEQGADTIVWLAASRKAAFCNGSFWFDRQRVTTHLLPWTREEDDVRDARWSWCLEHLPSHLALGP